MKTSKHFMLRIMVVPAISFFLSTPLMAQQEVSPDRFESGAQSVQNPGARSAAKKADFKRVNKQAKTQNARHRATQTAHVSNGSTLEQIARK